MSIILKKNKKIKKSFDEQAQRIAELQEENDEQAASIKALKRAKEQQENENSKLVEQVKNQAWELAQKNEELRSAAAAAGKLEQDYEKSTQLMLSCKESLMPGKRNLLNRLNFISCI